MTVREIGRLGIGGAPDRFGLRSYAHEAPARKYQPKLHGNIGQVVALGETDQVVEEFYAISVERRLTAPAVVAIAK